VDFEAGGDELEKRRSKDDIYINIARPSALLHCLYISQLTKGNLKFDLIYTRDLLIAHMYAFLPHMRGRKVCCEHFCSTEALASCTAHQGDAIIPSQHE
jgi:hypothetical protein